MGNSANLVGIYLLLGIPLLGLYAYMFDRWRKWAQPGGKTDDGLVSAFGFLAGFLILPFWYLKIGLKEKDGKAPVVFGVYWVLLAAAIWLGSLAMEKGMQTTDPPHEGTASTAPAEGGGP